MGDDITRVAKGARISVWKIKKTNAERGNSTVAVKTATARRREESDRTRGGREREGRGAERRASRTSTNGLNPEEPRGGGTPRAREYGRAPFSLRAGPFRVHVCPAYIASPVSSVSGAPISQLAEMRSQPQINDSPPARRHVSAVPAGRPRGTSCMPPGRIFTRLRTRARLVHARHNARRSATMSRSYARLDECAGARRRRLEFMDFNWDAGKVEASRGFAEDTYTSPRVRSAILALFLESVFFFSSLYFDLVLHLRCTLKDVGRAALCSRRCSNFESPTNRIRGSRTRLDSIPSRLSR